MIDASVFERLRHIGLTPALRQRIEGPDTAAALSIVAPGAALQLLRVTEIQREGLTLHNGAAEHPARQLPALRSALAAAADALAVGDWVFAAPNALGEWWVHHRVPPGNQLARRLHDGRDKVTRVVLVSNVDTALLVMGLDHDFSLRRLQRYVALVQMAGTQAVVVLTKKDLVAAPDDRLQEVRAMLPDSVPAVAVNALGNVLRNALGNALGTAPENALETERDNEPEAALSPWLQPGHTLVLLGSSGAGKSTLTNALTRTGTQDTGPNRTGDSRGRHTTTARSLHITPGGACIIDTPGLRTLRLDGDADALQAAFEDIAQLALRCRFRDCRHAAEPGCAVREGVGAERLRGFHKLRREAERDSITALERKAQVQQWKARGRDARLRTSAKRGAVDGPAS